MKFILLFQKFHVHAEIWLTFCLWSFGFLHHSNEHDCNTTAKVRNLVKKMCTLGAMGWKQGPFEDYVSTKHTEISMQPRWFSC
jgi:hypothetical protein